MRDGFALAASGAYRPFRDVADSARAVVAPVARVISIDEGQVWKPAPAPYLHAADVLGVEPGRLALVAVHSWDVHGAHRAGLVTGWSSRREGGFPATFDRPDVTGADLVEVAHRLLDVPYDTPDGSTPPRLPNRSGDDARLG